MVEEEIDTTKKIEEWFNEKKIEWKTTSRKEKIKSFIIFVMIIMLCLTFYLIGYGKATKNTVMLANDIVVDLINQNNVYAKEPSYVKGYMYSPLNKTLVKLGDTR